MSLQNYLLPFVFFFFNDTATTEIYTLSLHDALPISADRRRGARDRRAGAVRTWVVGRSEEHTSELQSRFDIVCRLLLEKKKLDHWALVRRERILPICVMLSTCCYQ